MSVVQEILTKLRDTKLDSLTRAELEQALYDVSPEADRRAVKGGMAEYLRRRYDLSFYEVRGRLTLRLAGNAVYPLWAALDAHQMTIHTAVTILVEARKRTHAKQTSLEVEIEDGIIAWEDKTVARKTRGGRTYRGRSNPSSLSDIQAVLEQIRSHASGYAERKAGILDGHTRRRIVNEMMGEVNAALASLLARLEREARKASEATAAKPVMRKDIVEACELLHVPSPSPTRPLDMKAVDQSYRSLVKRYHPDVTGNASTRELFQRVVQARDLLRRYQEETRTHDTIEG